MHEFTIEGDGVAQSFTSAKGNPYQILNISAFGGVVNIRTFVPREVQFNDENVTGTFHFKVIVDNNELKPVLNGFTPKKGSK